MKTILVLGAGRSSSSLISYLLEKSQKLNWEVVVGDKLKSASEAALIVPGNGRSIEFDLHKKEAAQQVIQAADVVISLLPPALHIDLAHLCMASRKHLLTASYVSDEMKKMHEEAKANGLLFLNECGLDPGIDHMSAMKIIDKIKSEGGRMISFESFTGGLIAPETDPNNPWRYKFTWNPHNVVTAGQSGAEYLKEGMRVQIPYKTLFKEITTVDVPGWGEFEGYANRDSLKYMETYGLQDINTMIRGTLRFKGFCSAWNVLVQLGCCNDDKEMKLVESMTHYDFINLFLKLNAKTSIQDVLTEKYGANENDLHCLNWSGLFSEERIGLTNGTPAQILAHILMKKWKLNPGDKDMIVMSHKFIYEESGVRKTIQSSLVVKGDDERKTAMAKTVGLPLGMATKLLLENRISQRGVCIPVDKEFYEPVLEELKEYKVDFIERKIA